jgi:hypothetical protein
MTVRFSTRCPNSDYLGFETSPEAIVAAAKKAPLLISNLMDLFVSKCAVSASKLPGRPEEIRQASAPARLSAAGRDTRWDPTKPAPAGDERFTRSIALIQSAAAAAGRWTSPLSSFIARGAAAFRRSPLRGIAPDKK